MVAGTAVFSFLALTAHFGSFLFGLVLWPSLLAAVFFLMPPQLRERRTRLVVAVVTGSVLLALIYYTVGYWELFTDQWERVLTRDYAVGDLGVSDPLEKLQFNIPIYRQTLGIVFASLALLGALPILRRPGASPLHAASFAWMGVAFLFLILDLTTALEVRYVLQVLPLLALFAGNYLAGVMERGKLGKLATGVVLAYLLFVALTNIHECLLFRYH